jgi:hypothetical protein
MQFGNLYRPDEREGCCPECTAPRPQAGEQCVRCGRTAVQRIADWYDYSHLVGNRGMREAGFDHLLTDYDQLLLQFGMHILWKV